MTGQIAKAIIVPRIVEPIVAITPIFRLSVSESHSPAGPQMLVHASVVKLDHW